MFLRGRKEGPGGISTLVTNGSVAKVLTGSVHELPISKYRSAWKVYRCRPLRIKLKILNRQITIQWIPGNSEILRNEMADSVVKQACSENAQLPGVTYTSICARIRHVIKHPPTQHEITAEAYSAYSSSREFQIQNRRYQTLLAKLCTGKYKGLRPYKILLDGCETTCPLCNQEPQDLQHWLQR